MKIKVKRSNITGFGRLLDEAIKKKFKNQMEFAKAIGVTQATVSRYISESASPSFHILHKISETLDIDMPTMKNSSYVDNKDNLVVKLPFYHSEMSAGKGLLSLDECADSLKIDEVWLKSQFLIKDSRDIFAFRVCSDSMNPVIQEGDTLFAKQCDYETTQLQGIYMISYNNDYLVKKIQFKQKGLLKLISSNPDYDPVEINLSEDEESFRIVARVLGRINTKNFA